MACISGYLSVVELLLTEGADPKIFDIRTFFLFIVIFLYLFYKLCFINLINWTPLHRAALWSHISIIKLLLSYKADPKAADDVYYYF